MLLSLFFVGFFAAITFTVGLDIGQNIGQKTYAAPGASNNLAPLSTISSSSFASQDEGWDKAFDGDLSSGSTMAWNSQGKEPPYVELRFPIEHGIALKSVVLSIDPANPRYQSCGVKAFEFLGSTDGETYHSLVSGVKSHTVGAQEFTIANSGLIRSVKFLLKSNWGDANYTCVKEVQVLSKQMGATTENKTIEKGRVGGF